MSGQAIFETLTFDTYKFTLQSVIPKENLEMRILDNAPDDYLVSRLEATFIGKDEYSETVEEVNDVYPATMWEELKEDFSPAWLKRRCPVRYHREIKRVTINHYRICPHLGMPKEKHIKYLMTEVLSK